VGCRIINLEEGRPTVNVALLRLDHALSGARSDSVTLLKLIWKALDRLKRDGAISGFIPGEDFRLSNEAAWALVKRDKAIKEDRDFGRGNRGITMVVL